MAEWDESDSYLWLSALKVRLSFRTADHVIKNKLSVNYSMNLIFSDISELLNFH